MAKAAQKASVLTTLTIGSIEVPVALYNAHADPTKKMVEFAKAGPNGGALKMQSIARPLPVEQTVELPDEPVVRHDVIDDAPALDAAEPESDPREWFPPAGSAGPMLDPSKCGPPEFAGWLDPKGSNPDLQAWAGVGEDTARPSAPTFPVDADPPAPRPIGEVFSTAIDGEYGRQLVEEGTGAIVPPENIRRGVLLEDGRFIDCTEQIAKIEEITKLDRMDVLRFVDVSQVPRAMVKGTYYIGAVDEQGPKPLRLVFEALKATRRAALVKLTKRSRQTLGVIGWKGDALVLYELVWAEDLREPPAKARAIQRAVVSEQEVAMACELVQAMSGPIAAVLELRDDAIKLREDLYAAALAGEVESVLVPEKPVPVDDVMAQLEASLAAVNG